MSMNAKKFYSCHHVVSFCECEMEAECLECGATWSLDQNLDWDKEDEEKWVVHSTININL